MVSWLPLLLLVTVGLACAFLRVSLRTWTIATAVTLLFSTVFIDAHWAALLTYWVLFAAIAIPLNYTPVRLQFLTAPMLDLYRRITPKLSATEQTALDAGTVGWEGQLFSGAPKWQQLIDTSMRPLSVEEQGFLDGPVEDVCAMVNDWEITHERGDLPPEIWNALKKHGFFAMIIPKEYGGLGYSAAAHSAVLQKLASASATVASTVAVPNSLGPAELLLHYGTDEQKNHYLPRLAKGEDVPCFALTSPHAGSDATSIPDYGVVCKGKHGGEEVLGIRLNFDKRYITLAPVATVVGLAFQLHDPEHLLGETEDLGITLALLPRDTPGMEIGRRHLPLNIPFQNGPVRGKDVFIPLSYIIGGRDMVGQGWRMLVECLSVGRAISLPSNSAGAMKMAALATGAYARIRKQFQLPIGRFEGVEEALARIGGHTYAISALTRMTAAAVDRGEKPSVPSAIAKYHATETGRTVIQDAMDVHGGKTIIMGPKNYLGRSWQGAPISVTVEGANILTRSMMIFGQGAIRCHPWVLKEMAAARIEDRHERLREFDKVLFKHVGFAFSNAARAFLLGLTHSGVGRGPGDAYTHRFYRKLTRYSAALALVADTSMLMLGGKLKQKESLSARLGDVLSGLYIGSAILKRYEDEGRQAADRPFVAWAMYDIVFRMQVALDGVLRNFPVRPVSWLLRLLVFPIGRRETPPSDRLGHRVASLLLAPGEARSRLTEGTFVQPTENNWVGRMEQALPKIIAAEPIERKFAKALRAGSLDALDPEAQIDQAVSQKIISPEEARLMREARALTFEIISVDDFDGAEFEAGVKRTRTRLQAAA